MRKLLLVTGLWWSLATFSMGQDLQYSQFQNAPFLLNPALAGVFSGHMRLSANYRNLWSSVPVGFNSFTAGFDIKHLGKRPRKGFFSSAYVFHFDQGGYTNYYKTWVDVMGSYTRRISKHMYTSVGVAVAPVFQGINSGKITTDSQWDPESGQYNPGAGLGETFTTGGRAYLDVSTGLNFRYQKRDHYDLIDSLDQRTRLDFGIGIFHLNRPDVAFLDGDDAPSRLNIRYSPYVFGYLQVGREIDLFLGYRFLYQDPHRENMASAGVRFHFSRTPGKQLSLQLGSAMRFHNREIDAVVPSVEAFFNTFTLGFSYDLNTSGFSVATNGNGGPTIFLSYIFKKVQPLPTHKACPII